MESFLVVTSSFCFNCPTSLLYCFNRKRMVADKWAYLSVFRDNLCLCISCSIMSLWSFSHDSCSKSLKIMFSSQQICACSGVYHGSSPKLRSAIVQGFLPGATGFIEYLFQDVLCYSRIFVSTGFD